VDGPSTAVVAVEDVVDLLELPGHGDTLAKGGAATRRLLARSRAVEHPRPAWILGLPLVLVGWLSAHGAAYALLAGDGGHRAALMTASGHGYLEHLPLAIAFCLTLAGAGFVARTRGVGRSLPPRVFAVLPLLGFAVQEHLERALHGGGLPWETGLEPVFLLGLLLQLPFALAAVVLAHALTGLADCVAALRRPHALPRRPSLLRSPALVELPLVAALAGGHAGRAPPFQA